MSPDPGSAPAIVCIVEAERSGSMIALNGRVEARVAARGVYRLAIVKDGPSGASRVEQSGGFDVAAGQTARVGSATLDFSARTHLAARLDIEADGQRFACERQEAHP